jgi:hypothetical protein
MGKWFRVQGMVVSSLRFKEVQEFKGSAVQQFSSIAESI